MLTATKAAAGTAAASAMETAELGVFGDPVAQFKQQEGRREGSKGGKGGKAGGKAKAAAVAEP